MVDLALAVFAGNAITLAFVWACFQFHKHDYRAPWAAYVAFTLPLLFVVATVIIADPPPHLDALATLQSDE